LVVMKAGVLVVLKVVLKVARLAALLVGLKVD
jgi:hypothetical protein